jgi:Uma2 family endonuclease
MLMTSLPSATTATELNSGRLVDLTEFDRLCRDYPDLRLERNAKGELIAMPPTGSETGSYNFDLIMQLGNWNRKTKLGKGFDSSTGFTLPNGAIRSPDLAWIARARWDALPQEDRQKFAPICPDFVLELVSRSDQLVAVQAKMHEYIDNGVRLGWLIDPGSDRAEIYRPDRSVQIVNQPTKLSGEEVLPGFELDLTDIW